MKHDETPKTGLNRRGFFAGMLSGLGVAAVVAGARKARAAAAPRKHKGPALFRRTAETERYLKSID